MRLRHLQSVLNGEPRLARAEIMKHVQKIDLKPEGKIYIASGSWNLLGSVAVTMVPGARIARCRPPSDSLLNWQHNERPSRCESDLTLFYVVAHVDFLRLKTW